MRKIASKSAHHQRHYYNKLEVKQFQIILNVVRNKRARKREWEREIVGANNHATTNETMVFCLKTKKWNTKQLQSGGFSEENRQQSTNITLEWKHNNRTEENEKKKLHPKQHQRNKFIEIN